MLNSFSTSASSFSSSFCSDKMQIDYIPSNLLRCQYIYCKSQETTSSTFNCLANHAINPEMRTKMVDWMTEVLTKLKSSLKTFFLSVFIMEKYLKHTSKSYPSQKLHIIGIVSMMIALKFEEVNCFSLKVIRKNIAHNNFKPNELIALEGEILTTINFDLRQTMNCDYLGFLFDILQPPLVVCRTAEIILILNRMEYNNCFLPSEEAACALILAAKSLNQDCLARRVLEVADIHEDDLEMLMISMRNSLWGYKIKKPKFKSPMRELGFVFESPDKQKFFKFLDEKLETSLL